jgi:hypothetical protein
MRHSHTMTVPEAQNDFRRAYRDGAPGVLASGVVWLVAAAIAHGVSTTAGVLALLVGGMGIHPLGVLIARLSGASGAHAAGNPLGRLALEGTFWMLAGIALAFGMQVLRIEWFFPAMLLVIGGRYLTFQTLYGLRHYWVLGALLCGLGLLLALLRVAPALAALAGGASEVLFAIVLWRASSAQALAAAGATGARPWTILAVADVAHSTRWYQTLFGRPETPPAHAHAHFGQVADADGTVLVCLHAWGEHAHPTLRSPGLATPGNGVLLFFRVADFAGTLERARGLVGVLAEEPHRSDSTGTDEFALIDPDGYYVMVSADGQG